MSLEMRFTNKPADIRPDLRAFSDTAVQGNDLRRQQAVRSAIAAFRANPRRTMAYGAAGEIFDAVSCQFGSRKHVIAISESELASRLSGATEKCHPILLPILEEAGVIRPCSEWQIHLIEVAGFGAKLDELATVIRSNQNGTWRALKCLEPPIFIPAFGNTGYLYSGPGALWPAASLSLTFSGHLAVDPDKLLAVSVSLR